MQVDGDAVDGGESSSILSTTTDSDTDSSLYEDEDDDHGEEEEACVLVSPTLCLFCQETLSTPELVITDHSRTAHGIDIVKEFEAKGFDSIDFIKLVNFLRLSLKENRVVDPKQALTDTTVWRTNDLYMKPVLSEDPLLTFDIESCFETNGDDTGAAPEGAHVDDQEVLKSPESYLNRIQELKSTIESMRACMKNVIEGQRLNVIPSIPPCILSDTSGKDTTSVQNVQQEPGHSKKHKKRRVKKRPSTSDTNQVYFSSYSHFGIHHEMLSDFVRTDSYRKAILENPCLFEGSRVLDVGCGTGILSLFAATAGAAKVTAVDDSDIAFYAMMIVAENKFKHKIDVMKTRLERMPDVKGPEEKYDVIISEWMGYFLVYEGMLDTIITARDRFLKPGGLMMPSKAVIKLAALSDQSLYDKHVSFWNNVYGYCMSSLRSECITEPLITVVKESCLCSNEVSVAEIDCMTCTLESTRLIESDVCFRINQTTTMHAIVGWFDCFFDHKKEGVILSTSPFTPDTHWKQTVFLLRTPITVTAGSDFSFKLTISRPKHEDRALKVDFEFANNSKQEYVLL